VKDISTKTKLEMDCVTEYQECEEVGISSDLTTIPTSNTDTEFTPAPMRRLFPNIKKKKLTKLLVQNK